MNQPQEVGYVVNNRNFLIHLDGLPSIKINDMVQSATGARGWVNSIAEDTIEVLMVDESNISPKQLFKKLPDRLGIAVGDFLLGRSINPLGVPIDGRGFLSKTSRATVCELEQPAPEMGTRHFITDQFITGITLIDTLIPIGRGQRELILGDAHSGKTSFLIDLIVNQKTSGTICIYASIGKPTVAVRNLIDTLKVNGALSYTVVIATSSSEPAPLIFLTPKTAFTVAEYFQKKGKDVLVILDDMGTHAKVYREIALLGNKSPGRQSYPGDIFFQHAHLMERAGNFKKEYGGGSITALPVMELNFNDFTTLIPTNLMSMTDGHLLFKSNLYSQGQRPAIDISFSVSRVGRQTQDRISNLLAQRVRKVLSQAVDLETISHFSSELSPETQLILKIKDLIEEMIKQDSLNFIPRSIQIILLSLPFTTFLENKDPSFLEKYKQTIIKAFLSEADLIEITKRVTSAKDDEQLINLLEGAVKTLAKVCI